MIGWWNQPELTTFLQILISAQFVLIGELGWELYMPINKTTEVYNALHEAGQEHGIGDFGAYAMNTLRLEKGFRAWKTEVWGR